MASLRFYAVIYVLLMTLAATKFLFFEFFDYWYALTGTMAAALIKTGLIAGYFQHLRHEPRSLTYLAVSALVLVLLLMSAATFSIT